MSINDFLFCNTILDTQEQAIHYLRFLSHLLSTDSKYLSETDQHEEIWGY